MTDPWQNHLHEVLLCNFGGPERGEDVEPFLIKLFEDPFIIRAPLGPFRPILARRIAIEVDRGLVGNAYWSPLVAPDMSPTGAFNLPTGGTVARRIRIRILDVWDPAKAVRIDGLLIQ